MACAGYTGWPWDLVFNEVRRVPFVLIDFLTLLLQTNYATLNSALVAAFSGSLTGNEANVYCAANADVCLGEPMINIQSLEHNVNPLS